MVGTIIGTAIFRTPGSIAALLHNEKLIIAGWIGGGIYVLLAVGTFAELATMLPTAGRGFIYTKRAFGNYPGFVVGWFAFAINVIAAAYIAMALGEYVILLFSPLKGNESILATSLIALFTLFQMLGVKSSSRMQQVTSFLKVLFYLLLVICCFVVGPAHAPVAEVKSTLTTTVLYGSFILSFIGAMQLILGTYDGFDAPLFLQLRITSCVRMPAVIT